MSDVTEFINAIYRGDFDDETSMIKEALEQRRILLSTKEFASIKRGDRIQFNRRCKPTYLQDVTATVVSVSPNTRKITVNLDYEVHGNMNKYGTRKRWKDNITVPLGIYEKVGN